MTDARFPDRWLNDRRIMTLSAESFRAFVVVMTWAVSNRTEGLIAATDLDVLPRGVDITHVHDLVSGGLMVKASGGWLLVDFPTTQTTRAELEANDRQRVAARVRKRRQREREGVTPDVTRDMPRDVTPDVAQDSLGKARPGQARNNGTHSERANNAEQVAEEVAAVDGFWRGHEGAALDGWSR